jgi:hypothetical protein
VSRNKKEAEKRDTDYWVMQATAYNRALDMRAIIDYRRGRGTLKKDLLTTAREFYDSFAEEVSAGIFTFSSEKNTWLNPKWFIEDVAGQDFLVQDFETEFGPSNVIGISTTYVSKNSGLNGLPAVSLAFERIRYIIPVGDKRSHEYAIILRDEASEYLRLKHDDVFMTQMIAEQALGQLGYRIRTGNPEKIGMPNRKPFRNLPTGRQRSLMGRKRRI